VKRLARVLLPLSQVLTSCLPMVIPHTTLRSMRGACFIGSEISASVTPNPKEMKKNLAPLEEIARYLHERYKELVEGAIESLKKRHLKFVDGGSSTGALTTNATEGVNWRIKYEKGTI